MLDHLRQLFRSEAQDEGVQSVTPDPLHNETEASTNTKLGDFAIDDYRPMKIIVIGAGISGILAGIRFRQYIQNLNLTIYEREDGIGGTWHINRYPGIACDIPSHCYQYTFETKSDWTALYSSGAEIREHLESIVAKYKLHPYIQLQHELVHARWDEAAGKWRVRLRRPSRIDGDVDEVEDEADFLFMGTGTFSRWSWPDIDGLNDFTGTLVHSANWNLGGVTAEEDVKDWGEKSVAVIGLGSSSLQLVSTLQDKVGRLSQYARGKTWICPPFLQDKISEFLSRDLSGDENYTYTEDEIESFQDPVHFAAFRRALDDEMNRTHTTTLRGSMRQLQAQQTFREYMASALASTPDVAEKLIPDFPVGCRRLTPAPGYLTALGRDNVDFINIEIERITVDGIQTADSEVRKHDVIICATGFDVSHRFPFPIIGRGGIDLYDKWSPHPMTYLSVCVDGFPNYFFSYGPNSTIGSGVLLPLIEHQVGYAVAAARKLQRERLKSIEAKAEAVRDFDELIESYFPKTVHTEKVRSWYKMGKDEGRVVALWPGSSLHCLRALEHPRWEDFNYERVDPTENRLRWLGNGMTLNEITMSGNRAWFLDEDYVDVPPVLA